MLDLPGHPVLDKQALIGGCVRLPLQIDAARLQREVAALPASSWGTTGPRVGVHDAADALFLRGYLPALGDRPFDEQPALESLPYAREIISRMIPAPPLRCLLARLPAGATILPHVDRAPYFSKSLRIHIPVVSHARVFMMCNQQHYVMKPGEAWAINNSAVHGVWNDDQAQVRIHMICDFLASPELADLLARGDRRLGGVIREVREHFIAMSRPTMASE
jgi:hypothetical protein